MKKSILFVITFTLFNHISSLELKPLNKDLGLYETLIDLKVEEPVIEESIKIVTDSPDVEIENFEIEGESKDSASSTLKDLSILDKNFKVLVQLKMMKNIKKANIYLTYQLYKSKEIQEKFFPIKLINNENSKIKVEKKINDATSTQINSYGKKNNNTFWNYIEQFAKWVQGLLKSSNSLFIQLIAVFLLGMLMSLTPCIYPMIPITAGILQSYGSKSLIQNFTVSFLYSLGIATTFATFGLIAAFTGHLFGNLLTNPIFVIFIVLTMGYMGMSMFGIFEMYIPKFMQTNKDIKKSEKNRLYNFFAPFLLGVITGSVASPCLTPGLAFLLTLVATMANRFLGFILLFTAGIGLSLPLLIIGTFTSSLNVLPRAGTWMIEIKKLFGLILFGMCFYFLNKIVPFNYLLIMISIFCLLIGTYYFYNINKKVDSKKIRIFKNLLGAAFLISSILVTIKAIQETCFPTESEMQIEQSFWHHDLESALKESKLLEQNLLVDIGGQFCSICKAIDKKIFEDKKVQQTLQKVVALKINASEQIESYNFFRERFKIIGVPTILFLTPDLKLIKRWGGELYNQTPEEFIKELNG